MAERPKGAGSRAERGDRCKDGTWDDSTVIPVPELKRLAKRKGEKPQIAEIFTLRGIKNFELEREFHKYKGRIVHRGD